MKTKSLFLGLFGLFLVANASAQQIGDGTAVLKSSFNANLPSGFYRSNSAMANYPQEISAWPWKHLINLKGSDGYTTCLLQLSAAYTQDDRVFFRKAVIDQNNPNVNNSWYELATRGSNTFIGSQYINGGLRLTNKDGDVESKCMNMFYWTDTALNQGHGFLVFPDHLWIHTDSTPNTEGIHINKKAHLGIGRMAHSDYKLDVKGTIRATEIRVETGWADFVFKKDYQLPSLQDVKAHINEHQHLPGIPSEAEVKENGVGLAEMTTKLLQKVEELTLYAIQQQETIEKLNNKVQELENSNK